MWYFYSITMPFDHQEDNDPDRLLLPIERNLTIIGSNLYFPTHPTCVL